MAKRRLLVACLALSCGAPQRPTAPADAGIAVETYAPLAFKADAKLPDRAVILGTDATGGSSVTPLVAAGGTRAIDAFVVSLTAAGDVRPTLATVTLGATPAGAVASPTGSGKAGTNATRTREAGTAPGAAAGITVVPAADSAWRAGASFAAHAAATALGKDLTDVAFSATGGRGDGLSASALATAGFVAALTGAPLDPSATLLGVLLPDGTLGPVPALPELVAAAIENGKRRIGIPSGTRRARSVRTGKLVDVRVLASRRGAQVVELADVPAAYALLTNAALPAPLPVDATAMALDASTRAALEVRYKAWQRELAAEWGSILQLESAGRLPALLVQLRDAAKRHARAAERFYKQHRLAAAYTRMIAAVVDARSANQTYDVLAKVQENKLDAALAKLDALDTLAAQSRASFDQLGALHPTTFGGHVQMLAALRAALRGWLFGDLATRALATTREYLKSLAGNSIATLGAEQTADAVVARLGPTIRYVALAVAETTRASEQLELPAAADVAYAPSMPGALDVAAALQAVGTAGVAYVDEQLVAPYAASTHRALDAAREHIALHEPDYVLATGAAKLDRALPKELATAWGESSLAWTLLSLAAGELARDEAAALIAAYAVLGAPLGTARPITRIADRQALAHMLDAAERAARMHARAARIATGAIPVQARIAYQVALAERGGSLDDKLDALRQFWSASAWSETAVMLARNGDQTSSTPPPTDAR